MNDKKVAALVALVESAAYTISEMGCTCQDRTKGHQRGCVGYKAANDLTAKARRIAARTKESAE